jgi:hypothetical protein
MAEEILVKPEIELGRELFESLASEASLRIEAALWWKGRGEWQLIIATPLVHEQGRIATVRRIRQILSERGASQAVRDLLERADVLSPSESGVINIVQVGSYGQPPLYRLIDREGVNALWVEGAYIYHFAPKSFIEAA